MGDGARDSLRQWVKGGMQIDMSQLKPIVRVTCDECGKEVHGQAALMKHNNAKHGTKHTIHEIDLVHNGERWE